MVNGKQEQKKLAAANKKREQAMNNPEKSQIPPQVATTSKDKTNVNSNTTASGKAIFENRKVYENHNIMLNKLSSSGYIILSQANANNVTPYGKESKLLSNGNLWHKIFVLNAEYLDREFVLKTIIESVYPNDLIPVSYKVDGIITSFIARNCGPAITQLAKRNFIIPNPEREHIEKRPFVIQVVLAFSNTSDTQLNVQDNIMSTLNRRYNQTTKVLNLEMFHKDTCLSNLIFCVLSQPKILYFVLHLAKNLVLHTLKLNNNEIRNVAPLEILSSCKTLVCLDLRNNLIDSVTTLYPLKTTSVTELWIDGNPLCENYNEITYIEAVKEVCPAIEKLDGVLLAQHGLPSFRRNYLIDNEAQGFINQFLEHFFSFYDSNNRKCLDGLYHPEAKFSLTCNYIPNQVTSATARLLDYKTISRNLIALSDLLKCTTLLSYGANVINRLCYLPITEHDPHSFTVDCVHYSESQVVLVVNGVFREPSETLLEMDRILGFCRTFVLKAGLNGEWNIINDMLHVSNATTVMAQKAFKISKTSKLLRFDHTLILEARSLSDKERMVDAFKKVTNLNQEWSKKCLEESKWNFLGALTIFVDLYKIDRMPAIAFEGSVSEPTPLVTEKFSPSIRISESSKSGSGSKSKYDHSKTPRPNLILL